jgi:hypothetical protein
MARGKKKEASEDEGQAPKGGPTHQAKAITKGKLLDLLKAKRQAREYVAETNGTLGQRIADAVSNYNMDKKAFGWLSQLDRMEPERAKALMDNFEHMLDVSGIKDRLAKVQRLPLNDEEEEEEEPDTNVSRFPAAAGSA